MSNIEKIVTELKKRKVFKSVAIYAAFSFVLIQVCAIVFPALYLPDWTMTFIVVVVIIGFPVTILLSWIYDITPTISKKNHPLNIKDDVTGESMPIGEQSSIAKKILFPLTGLILTLSGVVFTLLGGGFWLWYGFGNVSHGSDFELSLGIKKTVAVLSFDNLSGDKEGDYFCSGLSESIRLSLTKLGKLDVKSRLSSAKLKNKEESDSELDYFLEGSLATMGDSKNINIGLVNAQTENTIWTREYRFSDNQIEEYQDSILYGVLSSMDIDPHILLSSKSSVSYKNKRAFRLLGKGLFHFDQKNYSQALVDFDSSLVYDPDNVIAKFHRANSLVGLKNYTDAKDIYKQLLSQSTSIDHYLWKWFLPSREGMAQSFNKNNVLLLEEAGLAVFLLEGKDSYLLTAFDLLTQNIVWENIVPDKFIDNLVLQNNLIFLTSHRASKTQAGEPTLYAYDVHSGRSIYEKEFQRDNENQAIRLEVILEYEKKSTNKSTSLLFFKKNNLKSDENVKSLALINNKNGSVIWSSNLEFSTAWHLEVEIVNADNRELLLIRTMSLGYDALSVLDNKTGRLLWNNDYNKLAKIWFWGGGIIVFDRENNFISLLDPFTQKESWKYAPDMKIKGNISFGDYNKQPIMLLGLDDENIVAINFDGGFLNWNLIRWHQKIGIIKQTHYPQNLDNRVLITTEEDTLFTVRLNDGIIINRIYIDRDNHTIYSDDTQNASVLRNSHYLIGVDPLNGTQLWKIKNVDQGMWWKGVLLFESSILVSKPIPSDSAVHIISYNRDNGNINWSETMKVPASFRNWGINKHKPGRGMGHYSYNASLQYYNNNPLLILHDGIIQLNMSVDKKSGIEKKDVALQIARLYAEINQYDLATSTYNSILEKYDQMNQDAHLELANIYQKKGDLSSAISSLLYYYDLILPSSRAGTLTIQKLKTLSGLRWEKNITWDDWDVATIAVDDERIFRFMHNNVEAYRINSGALIWKGVIGDVNFSTINESVENDNFIFLLAEVSPGERDFFNKQAKTGEIDPEQVRMKTNYSLIALDKKNGESFWNVPLKVDGRNKITWMKVNDNIIYIQSIYRDSMSLYAFTIDSGTLKWKLDRNVSILYPTYNLQLAFYEKSVLLPLDNKIEYINMDSGNVEREYNNDYIEQIICFNEHSIQNNAMLFIIEDIDYEYMVVNLVSNVLIDDGSIVAEYPPNLSLFANNIYFDIDPKGTVAAFNSFGGNNKTFENIWKEEFDATFFLAGNDRQNLYLLNSDINSLFTISNQQGSISRSTPLLWPPQKIKIKNNYVIVQSERKLYLISI